MPVESCTPNLPALPICIYQSGPAKNRPMLVLRGKEMSPMIAQFTGQERATVQYLTVRVVARSPRWPAPP